MCVTRMPFPLILLDQFWYYHFFCLFAHIVTFVTGTVFVSYYGTSTFELGITGFKIGAAGSNSGCAVRYPKSPSFSVQNNQVCTGVSLSPEVLVVFTEGATAFFHILYLVNLKQGFCRYWEHKSNWLRATEWAITATSLSLANLVGVGLRDLSGLVLATVVLVSVQYLGYLSEVEISRLQEFTDSAKASFTWASVLQLVIFAVVLMQVFSIDSSRPTADGRSYTGFQVQSFLYIALYLSFGAVALWYSLKPRERPYLYLEWLFLQLGVWVKLSIYGMIFGSIREAREFYGAGDSTGVNWFAVRVTSMCLPAIIVVVELYLRFVKKYELSRYDSPKRYEKSKAISNQKTAQLGANKLSLRL